MNSHEEHLYSIQLSVPDMHCAGCMGKVEKALITLKGVASARANLTTRQVKIRWKNDTLTPETLIEQLAANGYSAQTIEDMDGFEDAQEQVGHDLLRALAVSGFAAGNVMLLSVSVWAGADDTTRDLFHWISALISLPTIVYAGQTFFRSAWVALRHGRMNMDVPISLAVILAGAMSLFETMAGRDQVYFDAAVSLLFFLLVGRYLDHMMRTRVRNSAVQLLKLSPKTAITQDANGHRTTVPVATLEVGMKVVVLPGAIVPVDGRVITGTSELDRSLVTGESLPEVVKQHDVVQSGVTNLTAPLLIEVTAVGKDSFLASVIGLMEAAEQHKSSYVRIADRLAAIYAPFVHIAALLTFIGWLWVTQGDWQQALLVAISVLIITCPCALGLAVPVVQVVANGVLFSRGVLVKDGAALERLAQIDSIVLDKTGTVTTGKLVMQDMDKVEAGLLGMAAGLATNSTHPLSQAVTAAAIARSIPAIPCNMVQETPGQGLEGQCLGDKVKIGSADWCGVENEEVDVSKLNTSQLWIKIGNKKPVALTFTDHLRDDAKAVIDNWKTRNLKITLLSGDRSASVATVAQELNLDDFIAEASPANKVEIIKKLEASQYRVLMIGDGINDAPALAAAHASMAPASASDIGRAAADMIFLGAHLAPAAFAWHIARRARRLIQQNFGLALAYNLIAIPVAMAGLASPLVAAVAMSTSSIVVTLNALRLRYKASGGMDL
jgi:P-type Cu2+ transporter